MIKDSDFFKEKFIDYYHIDISHIEELLLNELQADEILAISLSDTESKMILSSTNHPFQGETIENNKIVSLIIANTESLNNENNFIEFKVTTNSSIQITRNVTSKRDMLLYIIFDVQKTNLALANNKIINIIKNIESILNNDK